MGRLLIALGGNALGNTYLEQQVLIKNSAKNLVKLFDGNEVVLVHGNGPQVGMITKSFVDETIEMPLDCCTAMSQGYIGFHIQREIKEVLNDKKIKRDVVTLITEVVVDENDKSFKNPTKPIGKFYTKEEAEELSLNNNDIYKEDANRGYRKVVASPRPIDIKNLKSINTLIKSGTIVIAAGGGGVPVYNDPNSTRVDAVIDKDLAAALLAIKLNVDKFIILTAVDRVLLNYGLENQMPIDKMTVKEAEKYINNNEFKEGSMLPKVKAAIEFVNATGKDAIITSLSNVKGITNNKNITIVSK